jgi:hypothetical protein
MAVAPSLQENSLVPHYRRPQAVELNRTESAALAHAHRIEPLRRTVGMQGVYYYRVAGTIHAPP